MYKDTVITLDNNVQLLIINEVEFAGRRFVLGVEINTDKDEIHDDEYIIQEIIKDENGDDKLISIDNPAEAESFSKLLLVKEINEK